MSIRKLKLTYEWKLFFQLEARISKIKFLKLLSLSQSDVLFQWQWLKLGCLQTQTKVTKVLIIKSLNRIYNNNTIGAKLCTMYFHIFYHNREPFFLSYRSRLSYILYIYEYYFLFCCAAREVHPKRACVKCEENRFIVKRLIQCSAQCIGKIIYAMVFYRVARTKKRIRP